MPIPKYPGTSDPTDHQPISLISVVRKVYENLLASLTTSLSAAQSAFRKGMSTLYPLTTFADHLHRHQGRVHAVLEDIIKAYDHVVHSEVYQRLLDYGIPPVVAAQLTRFLPSKVSVLLSQLFAPAFWSSTGLPQGLSCVY